MPLNTCSFAKNVTAHITNHTDIKQNWQTTLSTLASSLRTKEPSSHHDPDQTFPQKSRTVLSGKPYILASLTRNPTLLSTVKESIPPSNISIVIGIKYNSLRIKENLIGLCAPVTFSTLLLLYTLRTSPANKKPKI